LTTLSSFKTIAAAALLSAITATQVFAQAAISEPAAFQSLHPYLDVLNGGAPTPAYWLRENPQALRAYQARESGIGTRHWPNRSYHSGR
jgi:hypothetical protein